MLGCGFCIDDIELPLRAAQPLVGFVQASVRVFNPLVDNAEAVLHFGSEPRVAGAHLDPKRFVGSFDFSAESFKPGMHVVA